MVPPPGLGLVVEDGPTELSLTCRIGHTCNYNQILLVLVLQWNGKESNKDERAKAAEFMLSIKVRNLPMLIDQTYHHNTNTV